jgi:hypothetical protein
MIFLQTERLAEAVQVNKEHGIRERGDGSAKSSSWIIRHTHRFILSAAEPASPQCGWNLDP